MYKHAPVAEDPKVYRHDVSPIVSCKMPTARLNTVHADLCGPCPECQRFSYLLVCIDKFLRFVTAYPLRNIQTESLVIDMNAYIVTFGQMRVLRVDNGVQWTSNLFKDYVTFLECDLVSVIQDIQRAMVSRTRNKKHQVCSHSQTRSKSFAFPPLCYHFVPEHHASSRAWFISRAHVFPRLTTTGRLLHDATTSIFTTITMHYSSN